MTTFIMSNPFLFAVAVLQLCAFGWYWRHGALLWGLLQAGSEPIEFVVYGRVAAKTRLSLVVDCWEYLDAKTPYDSNEKRYTILRRVVSRVVVLEPRPEGTKI